LKELKCAYCGDTKKEIRFMIGAKLNNHNDFDEWTMHEGTGKISCPNCYPKGEAEAQAVIDRL